MKKILIIEDEPDLLENFAEIFEEDGYTVLRASSGKEGVASAKMNIPDVILCDIMMPGIDGFGVKKKLAAYEDTISIPFIFLTAKSSKDEILEGLKTGADDYITKPIKARELLKTVKLRLKRISDLKIAEGNTTETKILPRDGRILLKINNNPTFVNINSIVVIAADDYYSIVHLNDQRRAILKKTLKSWQKILPDEKFLRVHRSVIVNMDYIEKIEKWSKSTYVAHIKNYSEPIQFSYRYSQLVRERMMIK
ncbi:MAG: response regulator [bacterium]